VARPLTVLATVAAALTGWVIITLLLGIELVVRLSPDGGTQANSPH
jgi:hypothetical protein